MNDIFVWKYHDYLKKVFLLRIFKKSFILSFRGSVELCVFCIQYYTLDIIFTKISTTADLFTPLLESFSLLLFLICSASSTEILKPCLHLYSVRLCSCPFSQCFLFQICLLTQPLLPSACLWTPSALWPAVSQQTDTFQLLAVCLSASQGAERKWRKFKATADLTKPMLVFSPSAASTTQTSFVLK